MIDNTIQSKLNELKENNLDVSIETSMVYVNEDGVAMCAKIHKDGCKVSSGHAYVPFSEAGPKAMEWAETIALRRAIGFLMRNHSPSVEELHEAGSRQAKKMIEEYKEGVATWMLATLKLPQTTSSKITFNPRWTTLCHKRQKRTSNAGIATYGN
jgi:hypothetical protein